MKTKEARFDFGLFLKLSLCITLGVTIFFITPLFISIPVLNPLHNLVFNLMFSRPHIVEITLAILLITLFIWAFKSTREKRYRLIFPLTLAYISPIILGSLLISVLFLVDSFGLTNQINSEQELVNQKVDIYLPLVTTLFDKAEARNIRSDIDRLYNAELGYRDASGNIEGKRPIYFVRLKGGKLQKLFQGGDIKEETIDTSGEKLVAGMLEGKVGVAPFPQYTCCGGDDFWNELPIFNLLLPSRRYLGDLYSELEIISLIRDYNGRIVGARVLLHGD